MQGGRATRTPGQDLRQFPAGALVCANGVKYWLRSLTACGEGGLGAGYLSTADKRAARMHLRELTTRHPCQSAWAGIGLPPGIGERFRSATLPHHFMASRRDGASVHESGWLCPAH
mmetsp:Transcript_7802/g.23389  ORF Transcript_7802/g.23389 Transcript_7802/m.23389 type:complete len:116 (-) Transcript_7802:1566-1913(-)